MLAPCGGMQLDENSFNVKNDCLYTLTGGGYNSEPCKIGTYLDGREVWEQTVTITAENLYDLIYNIDFAPSKLWIVTAFVECGFAVYSAVHQCMLPLPFITSKTSTNFESLSVYYDPQYISDTVGAIVVRPRLDSSINQIRNGECSATIKFQYIM